MYKSFRPLTTGLTKKSIMIAGKYRVQKRLGRPDSAIVTVKDGIGAARESIKVQKRVFTTL